MFRSQFVDLAKLVELGSPKDVDSFKQTNGHYMKEHMKKDGHSEDDCCGSVTSRYYMPRDKMTTADRIIDDMLFRRKDWFSKHNFKNMRAILENINGSYHHFSANIQAQKMPFELADQ